MSSSVSTPAAPEQVPFVAARNPAHIAIILDGNGRWAQSRGKNRTSGHKQGVEAVRRTVKNCLERNIEYLTLFAFSSENWSRPEAEVSVLMELLGQVLKNDINRLHESGVRLNVIGDLSRFSPRLQSLIRDGIVLTERNTAMTLTLAINYGARWELVRATRRIAKAVKEGALALDEIDEARIADALTTAGMPDPDLLIRTSGEIRISNFLLWQIAYAELYFTNTHWPDFGESDLDSALSWYASRQRRFGRIAEQINNGGAGGKAI